jgi:hypothetical protein
MRIEARLARLEQQFRSRPRSDQLSIIVAVPVGRPRAGGRGPGLYRDGPAGSTAGVLVFDPAAGEPEVPDGRLAPWGLIIVCGPEVVEPPADLPGEAGLE